MEQIGDLIARVLASPEDDHVAATVKDEVERLCRQFPLYPDVPLVSISNSQRVPVARHGLNWAGTVYNGLDLSRYRSERSDPRRELVFLGRISPEKGPELAIDVARRAGRPLRLAAKVDEEAKLVAEKKRERPHGAERPIGSAPVRRGAEAARQKRSDAVADP